ncbi:porin [Marinobacterium lacunae]|nr:porin [Marinobacterium lacunae]
MSVVNMLNNKYVHENSVRDCSGKHASRISALSRTVIATLFLGGSTYALADVGVYEKAPEEGGYVAVGFFGHAGFSSVDYSDSTNPLEAKDAINDSTPHYYYGSLSVDPAYKFTSSRFGPMELKLHTAFQLDNAWLDNDQVDELSLLLDSKRYGMLYLGEDDGAADRLKPKQSGRAGLAVGHGAFTGIIPWWGNLPYAGGHLRRSEYDWDWPNGIVGGDWRSFSRDTQDAIKIGYQSPVLSGFQFGVSMNLQNTYEGFAGKGTAPAQQDSWSRLGFKNDEYEMALQWNGVTSNGLILSTGLTHNSVHVVNADMLQKSTDVGFKVGKKLSDGAMLSTSVYYAYEKYDNDVSDIHTDDRQIHWGVDWSKGKWKVGANYLKAWDSYNPPATVQLGGGGNEGYSLGADYKLAKGLTVGAGIIHAKNDGGEEATEVGVNLSYRFKRMIY